MATSIRSLIAAHQHGDKRSLVALGVALAAALRDTPAVSTDPVEVYAQVEDQGAETPGTWQVVRSAADHGELTPAEYDYLHAAVEALTQEAP